MPDIKLHRQTQFPWRPVLTLLLPLSPLGGSNGSSAVSPLAACGVGGSGPVQRLLRVVGGRRSSRGAWPWQTVIFNRFMVRSLDIVVVF